MGNVYRQSRARKRHRTEKIMTIWPIQLFLMRYEFVSFPVLDCVLVVEIGVVTPDNDDREGSNYESVSANKYTLTNTTTKFIAERIESNAADADGPNGQSDGIIAYNDRSTGVEGMIGFEWSFRLVSPQVVEEGNPQEGPGVEEVAC